MFELALTQIDQFDLSGNGRKIKGARKPMPEVERIPMTGREEPYNSFGTWGW